MSPSALARWIAQRDPGLEGLRRALRAAIALPTGVAIMLYVLDRPSGAVFTGFGTIGLLVTADFAGTATSRLRAYLVTGAGASALLCLGWVVSGSAIPAAVTTAVVAFGLSVLSVQRGSFAAGAPAALLVFILGATVGSSGASLADALIGWWTAVVVCTVVALTVLPRERREEVRAALARSLGLAAQAVTSIVAAAGDRNAAGALVDAFDASLDELALAHAGKPFRPSGATRQDRALTLLVDQVFGIRQIFRNAASEPRPTVTLPESVALGRSIAQSFAATGRAMSDRGYLPSVQELMSARVAFRLAAEESALTRSAAGEELESIAVDVEREHSVGIGSVLTEQMVQLARQANGGPAEDLAEAVAVPSRSWHSLILAQMTLRSPWMRNAVRSGVGLGAAMLVVTQTSIGFGFWVLLGVIAVLRFDALSTRRSALQTLIGTLGGVLIASGIIVVVGDREWILWVLLPLAVFAAAWTPVALNYPTAQAAFTGFVLLIVNIVDWPPSLTTGGIRLVDAALGAMIAVAVVFVMWPRGTSSALHVQLAADVQAAWAYLRLILQSFVTPVPDDARAQALEASRLASVRGSEAYDVAVMQRGPGMADRGEWAALTSDAYLMISVGRVFDPFTRAAPLARSSAALSSAVTTVMASSDERLQARTRLVESGSPGPASSSFPMTRPAITGRLTDATQAHAFVMTIWALDWVARIDVLADAAGQRVRERERRGDR